MVTITLLSLIACSGDKDDTAVEVDDTAATEETDTEETDTEETDTEETDTDEVIESAQVRVVHASPDAPNVDVYVNGEAAGINDLAFLSTTGFVELPAGDYSFAVAPAGTDFASAVPVTLDVTLGAGDVYTAVAHGYVDPSTAMQTNGFAITPFAGDLSSPSDGTFRVQVVHAAAADAFAKVDVWNITDEANPSALIPDFDYGEEVTTELPTGIAFRLGLDINADAVPDAVFEIPDSLTGFVSVYAVNDADGAPSLLAHFEDGTSAQITPVQ